MAKTNTNNGSGYQHCACRDCFETFVGISGDFCDECADCEADPECCAPNAYGCESCDGCADCQNDTAAERAAGVAEIGAN